MKRLARVPGAMMSRPILQGVYRRSAFKELSPEERFDIPRAGSGNIALVVFPGGGMMKCYPLPGAKVAIVWDKVLWDRFGLLQGEEKGE